MHEILDPLLVFCVIKAIYLSFVVPKFSLLLVGDNNYLLASVLLRRSSHSALS